MEKELIRSAKKGNTDAFEKLAEKYYIRIYNYSLRVLKNEQDALDASQDALIKAYININKFKEEANFFTWLFRITVNTCNDYHKRNKKRGLLYPIDNSDENTPGIIIEDKTQNIEEKIIENERKNQLYKAIDSLPEIHRKMILLRDIENFTYDEIAEIINLPLGTVKSKISRARLKLKELLLKNKELFIVFTVILTEKLFFK